MLFDHLSPVDIIAATPIKSAPQESVMKMKAMATRTSLRLVAIAVTIASILSLGHILSRVTAEQQDRQSPSIGRTYKESKPSWELPPQAAKGSPNVIYLVLDD